MSKITRILSIAHVVLAAVSASAQILVAGVEGHPAIHAVLGAVQLVATAALAGIAVAQEDQ